jgi:phage gp16-like protein
MSISRRLIAQIHIAKKNLDMDDDSYRSLLENVTGKRSCKGLDISELNDVLNRMIDLGFQAFKPNAPKAKKAAQKRENKRSGFKYSPKSGQDPVPMRDTIRAIWITMNRHDIVEDGSETALNEYCERMTAKHNDGVGVRAVTWLNEQQAYMVLEALKKWHMRVMTAAFREINMTVEAPRRGGEKYRYFQEVYERVVLGWTGTDEELE